MTATRIDGKVFAATLRHKVAENVSWLKDAHDITLGLAVVLVGENPASQVYVRNKKKQTVEAGMASFDITLPADITQDALIAKVNELNEDARVHGILVQLPLPAHIEEESVINAVLPEKDVDGFHVINSGKQMTGQKAMVPCTPKGCLMLLKDTLGDLSGKHAVVIGRSNIVGKPMAMLLLQANCTVTIAHSRTQDLEGICQQADILIAAVGRAEMVKSSWVKQGAVVIDVGINRIDDGDTKTKLVGDVAYEEVSHVASAITPVPGGVGPMTIACLLQNTFEAACAIHRIETTNAPNSCD